MMLVPIACRFVPYDQWFLTHLDADSKIKQIKFWILSKCNLVQSSCPQIRRPVSPITFAPSIRSRSFPDNLDDGYNEDDEYSDQDLTPLRHPKPRTSSYVDARPSQSVQSGSSPLVDQYTLLSFSTGSMLEDEFSLSWYNLRPYELLEMHPVGIVAPLQRDVLAEYIQPYFRAKVRVLRAVWNHGSDYFEPPGVDTQGELGSYKAKDKLAHRLDTLSPKSNALQSEKRRKKNWKARWVIINHGILSLCKEDVTSPPLQQFALNTIGAIRGADALERTFSIATQPRVVCIKFRPRSTSVMGVTSPPSSSPSSPNSEDLKTNFQEPLPLVGSASDLRRTTEQERLRERPGEYACDTNDTWRGKGEWIVLDMLDDHAFSSILRILHREVFHPLSSSFIPSSSTITLSHHSISSPIATSFVSYHDTIPYPEWRINTVENARKAGMGDVGKPMAWVLWTEKGLGETLLGNIRHHRQAFSREMQYKSSAIPPHIYGSDDESDDDSEMEWEGWMRDLERQSRVREREASRSTASKQARIPSNVCSPLPSPPLSEASPSGSPRARSPSLPASRRATGSCPHIHYPNIGNVIQASGSRDYWSTELPRSPEKIQSTTFSTVSVGTMPSSRRRSSTFSAEVTRTTKRDHDNQAGRVPVGGIRTNARTASTSAGMQWPPRISVRHAHSSSNLRTPSSYGSDATESPGHAGPSSPLKRQSAFMRSMSLRAGKIVRGLESAIDFVDEKNA